MIAVMIIVLVAVLVIIVMEIDTRRRLNRLIELVETPQEETLADKKKARLAKQWDAIMAYGGDVNGKTETDSDE